MTRNIFYQKKQLILKTANNLTLNKAFQLFLEDNEKLDMNNQHFVNNLTIPTSIKGGVNIQYCDINLITSDKKLIY